MLLPKDAPSYTMRSKWGDITIYFVGHKIIEVHGPPHSGISYRAQLFIKNHNYDYMDYYQNVYPVDLRDENHDTLSTYDNKEMSLEADNLSKEMSLEAEYTFYGTRNIQHSSHFNSNKSYFNGKYYSGFTALFKRFLEPFIIQWMNNGLVDYFWGEMHKAINRQQIRFSEQRIQKHKDDIVKLEGHIKEYQKNI